MPRLVTIVCILGAGLPCATAEPTPSLHETTVAGLVSDLSSDDPVLRAAAAENLGFLRACAAADALAKAATNGNTETRREACLSLAWCGGREQLPTLLGALSDRHWSVRQAAWVSLTNLTGMEFPFDAHAAEPTRADQVKRWRDWCSSLPGDRPPADLLAALGTPPADLAEGRPVTASSTYKGPPSILTDSSSPGFWQTKNVPFPQHCTVDLGRSCEVGCVTVSQYGVGFRMTDYSVSVSDDGETFRALLRNKGLTETELVVSFPETSARFVRLTSHASERATYPTTFHRISVLKDSPAGNEAFSRFLLRERAMRALGCLGGKGAAEAIIPIIEPYAIKGASGTEEKLMVQAGIRALGRLRHPRVMPLLVKLLGHRQWARYAADALGEFGSEDAALALIDAYPACAMDLARKPPALLPTDDKPGFEAVDRMYEAPHSIALALSRFQFESDASRAKLRGIAPLLVANMASDFDGAMLYEEQAWQKITGYLLDRAGMRSEIKEIAFEALGQTWRPPVNRHLKPTDRERLLALAKSQPGGTSFAAGWIAALCRDWRDLPRLLELLQHDNGWARINAAKALMFIGDRSAADRIATLLANSLPEAGHGYFNGFLFKQKKHQGQDEYNAPSPCWREAFTHALGRLGNESHVPLLVKLLNDDRNILEIRYAAADSLSRIGSPDAITALAEAATNHPFHSIRLLAREALWQRNQSWDQAIGSIPPPPPPPADASPNKPAAIVFIKGDNDMPNDFQIDIWRQAYSTTDSGPTYRLGRNLHLLKPATPDGSVTPLTSFADGFVADCEVSWDGRHVVFARRDAEQPWWHIWELDLASGSLRQLTHGPYHDVQPAYLPDGRIVFSSSRIGMRDEYHGYPATGLTVMNRDGSDIRCIGFNLGRDNEPSIMPDGRILFSRLELFYSRLKTEITVQTMLPDGTMNRTIYGPEKRDLWRNQTRLSGENGWGEAPPRHRVLRLNQPQPLNNERVVVATTGGATIVGPGRMNEKSCHATTTWP
jgi:HEAT repeat protein